ncbi:uncharacterized protein LOC127751016 [Frankliniella occidentalis]|uniref:Uncharacterized protein LOC127751016 n=1 Tax=Frankliniella occidentalis TaxID=133901 RepID=A0A9C6X641_FRAOC|nr:uncharacterized protein LOC127751016 [Frankliniella occidentalis]
MDRRRREVVPTEGVPGLAGEERENRPLEAAGAVLQVQEEDGSWGSVDQDPGPAHVDADSVASSRTAGSGGPSTAGAGKVAQGAQLRPSKFDCLATKEARAVAAAAAAGDPRPEGGVVDLTDSICVSRGWSRDRLEWECRNRSRWFSDTHAPDADQEGWDLGPGGEPLPED